MDKILSLGQSVYVHRMKNQFKVPRGIVSQIFSVKMRSVFLIFESVSFLLIQTLRSLTSYFLLKQDCIKLFGLTWHPDHLMCARCSKFLASKEKIFLHNDNVLCRTCISLMRSRKCFACGKVISSSNKGLHALGKEWHIACFICSVGIVLSILYV